MEIPLTILALDLGTSCGWASYEDGKVKSGTKDYSNGQWDGAGMRFLKFRKDLQMHIIEYGAPTAVFYEAVMSHAEGGIYASHVYGGYMGILQAFCENAVIPYHGVDVGTIKKFWTGKGNANKDAMVLRARKRGFNPKTDDEADALAILHYGVEFMKGKT